MLASANDTVRVACVGVHGQGRDAYRALQRQDAERRDRGHLRHRRVRAERPHRRSGEDRQEAPRRVHRSPQAARGQVHRRRFPSPRPTTTTPCRPSGPARPAKTSTWRSPARTTCSRRRQIVAAAQKYNRMVQHGTNSRSQHRARGRPEHARRPDRRRLHGARPVLQVARHHRPQAGGTRSRRRALRPVARARARARVHAQPLPLQLALVLGLRQRRHRQPGHSSGGCGALGPGREVSRPRSAPSAATSCSTTTRKRPTR